MDSTADRIKMVALWSFSGPEGATGRATVGLVRRGQEFLATPKRATDLSVAGKARRLGRVRVILEDDSMPRPEVARQTGPEEIKTSPAITLYSTHGVSVREVLTTVDAGQASAEDALASEQTSDSPRVSLIAALEQRVKAGA